MGHGDFAKAMLCNKILFVFALLHHLISLNKYLCTQHTLGCGCTVALDLEASASCVWL